MNSPLLQKGSKNYTQTASTENQRAKQHLISCCVWGNLVVVLLLVGGIWKNVVIVEDLTVGFAASQFIYLPLIFAVLDLCPAIQHFVLFRKLRREKPEEELEPLSIWADWSTGERSPVKATLVFVGFFMLLILLFMVTTYTKSN